MNATNYFEAKEYFQKNLGRIISLDIGKKKTGVAICDRERIIATPYPPLMTMDKKKFSTDFVSLVESSQAIGIIHGIPLDQIGGAGNSAHDVLKIVNLLKKYVDLPFFALDERFTTSYAIRILKDCGLTRKKREAIDDSVVASLVLEEFLRFYKN